MSNDEKFVCPKCGNDKDFYITVSVPAKLKYNSLSQQPFGKPYDIDIDEIDNYFDHIIYCSKCNEHVKEYFDD